MEEEQQAKPSPKMDWKMIGILAAVLAVIFAGFWFYIKQSLSVSPSVSLLETAPNGSQESVATESTESVEPTGSAEPTQSAQPTTQPTKDAAALKQAVLDRIGLSEAEVVFAVTTNTGTHAKGTIKEIEAVGGGYWLAAKSGTEWVAVYDGQTQPDCSEIEPYDFPTSMVPECLDEEGEVVTR